MDSRQCGFQKSPLRFYLRVLQEVCHLPYPGLIIWHLSCFRLCLERLPCRVQRLCLSLRFLFLYHGLHLCLLLLCLAQVLRRLHGLSWHHDLFPALHQDCCLFLDPLSP